MIWILGALAAFAFGALLLAAREAPWEGEEGAPREAPCDDPECSCRRKR